jgi:2-phosphoglycerate kinase
MTWDPFGTLRQALWIGGAQWAGKSTVANLLAHRFGLTAYHHDYHNARAHDDRRVATAARAGQRNAAFDAERFWLSLEPADMATRELAAFPAAFEWILDDLRALVSGVPVLAEGWGLRPELVISLVDTPDRMVVMVPTEEFRAYQTRTLDRATALQAPVSDPARAQRNRLARDRIIAADAATRAHEHGVRVIEVDGRLNADEVADLVADHFARFLPRA